jgi:predicted benzoate:H+ symporter BenE
MSDAITVFLLAGLVAALVGLCRAFTAPCPPHCPECLSEERKP